MALLAVACSPKAEPIDYGKEECAFCKMTIVSPQFASEVVTQKSKAFSMMPWSACSKPLKKTK